MALRVPFDIQLQVIEHCRAQLPNQACGLLLFDEQGVARAVECTPNAGAWPYGFQIPPESMYQAFTAARAKGLRVQSVYHCHAVSVAVPTGRDLDRPVPPGYLYLIVSLLDPNAPELRGFLLEGSRAREVNLETGEPLQVTA
ncbi:M67 family metallopeptidase [Blastococcus sp. CCUG 61487]|uniref:Mov34/MPN/PAD-1 family protein n=1 Tax=Blastococcus sp. CCUG 61487 TaxID=1840703 RepID=UPI001484E186|nr:M67 family metallopeptidase [Blastococcus sp. CCUG 61487]